MASDTPEIRAELDTAWRAVRDRLISSGYSRAAVVETMMTLALSDLDELYGLQEATHFILKSRSFRRRPDVAPAPKAAANF